MSTINGINILMLDLNFIRKNPEVVKKVCQQKNVKCDVDKILLIDKNLNALKTQVQELQAKKNSYSKLIPKADIDEKKKLITESKKIGQELEILNPKLKKEQEIFTRMLLYVPNIPSKETPIGNSAEDNVEIYKWENKKERSFKLRDHVEILELNDWAELKRFANVSGNRSYSLKGDMVLLEMAIINLSINTLVQNGFTLISMPSLVREGPLIGTGHFPSDADDVYYIESDDLYLSGTSEVQLNYLYSGEILKESDLPILLGGYSSCFRREAGSYGKDVRGLIRVHQFAKVEQYVICKNDLKETQYWQEKLLRTSQDILEALELPYHIIECCTGDMGVGKYRMFDIECWVDSEQKYRETHSCSSLLEWQARRTNTRYRDDQGNIHFCHTLNNTAIATPRILVPFMEHHQNEDGSISIPIALRPYLHGRKILKKS